MSKERIYKRIEEIISSQNYKLYQAKCKLIGDNPEDFIIFEIERGFHYEAEPRKSNNELIIRFSFCNSYFTFESVYLNNNCYYSIPKSLENKCIKIMSEYLQKRGENKDKQPELFSFWILGF